MRVLNHVGSKKKWNISRNFKKEGRKLFVYPLLYTSNSFEKNISKNCKGVSFKIWQRTNRFLNRNDETSAFTQLPYAFLIGKIRSCCIYSDKYFVDISFLRNVFLETIEHCSLKIIFSIKFKANRAKFISYIYFILGNWHYGWLTFYLLLFL